MYDVVIIGAGVSGAAAARELSRLRLSVLVVEREEDVCCGTSKANSAIVHAGFDAQTGTLMARLNVEGNRLMWQLSRELDFACERIGSLVVCTREGDLPALEALLARGVANGVPDLRIVGRDELREMEPNVSEAAVAALWAPTAGIVDPFGLNIALAENAAENGVAFRFDTRVTGVARRVGGGWLVRTSTGDVEARCVVNAAGVYADELHNLVCRPGDELTITPRRGQYLLLDTTAGSHVRHTVFMLPTAMGKGVLVTPTVHGNLLVGPTAEDISDKEGTDTTAAGLAEVAATCALTVRDVPLREVITSFSGLRAHQPGHEFVIGEVAGAPGFVDCAAIESPGLTASPAVGRMVAGIVERILHAEERPAGEWRATRRGIEHVERAGLVRWAELAAADPAYGHVVCRCCHVTEAEIVAACHETLPARSLDGVKRRTGACMGRCQAGFCTPRIMELLEREVPGVDARTVSKEGPGSELTCGAKPLARGGETDA